MIGHYIEVCEYGTIHAQCRCPGENKARRQVPCTTATKCRSQAGIVTFDLDSTVADTSHRYHLIDRENGTDWHAYAAACAQDEPVAGIVAMIRLLTKAGVECHALSGRKATALRATKAWFTEHHIPIQHYWLDETDSGDYAGTSDHVTYKLERLRQIEKVTGRKVILHVDDWAGVAVAFEAAGVPTVCVRTPFEIREMTKTDARTDSLK